MKIRKKLYERKFPHIEPIVEILSSNGNMAKFLLRVILICLYKEPQSQKSEMAVGPKPYLLKTANPKTQLKTPTQKLQHSNHHK